METYARLKQGMKWMWGQADYVELSPWLRPAAEALVSSLALGPGPLVLDVAAGNGNFAIAAARRGAAVTASDLTPRMLEIGRARSEADGLDIPWLEADAEELPFESDHFDVVSSVFGAMFAPRPDLVAAEMFRVARPGGRVAMANYVGDGFLRRLSDLYAGYGRRAPVEMPSPFLWGEPGVVKTRFAGLASSIRLSTGTLRFEFPSLAEGQAFWERTNAPLQAVRTMVTSEAYAELLSRVGDTFNELNQVDDGRLVLDAGYLLVVAVK